jgi:hypothetical protein
MIIRIRQLCSIASLTCLASLAPLSSGVFLSGCTGGDGMEDRPRSTVAAAGTDGGISVDAVEIVRGVKDRGRNPAVIALAIGDTGLCTGTLIAPDVVLTARHCVSRTTESVECPARGPQIQGERDPSTLTVLVGDDASTATAVARGRQVLTPDSDTLCGDDIALLMLDRKVRGIEPIDVRLHGIAKGDHVRAVGFGKRGDTDPAGTKLLRDHVQVEEVSAREFVVGEATCQGDSGGPALDETTGQIVGVVSRGGPSCDGPDAHNIYTRTDVFIALVNEALSRSGVLVPDHDAGASTTIVDGGASGPTKKPSKGTDMGGACQSASDCSAGVCVEDKGRQYCSRPCGTNDRCPAHFHCTKTDATRSVCIAQ